MPFLLAYSSLYTIEAKYVKSLIPRIDGPQIYGCYFNNLKCCYKRNNNHCSLSKLQCCYRRNNKSFLSQETTVLLQEEHQIISLTIDYSDITGGTTNHCSHSKLQCYYRRNNKSLLSQKTIVLLHEEQQIIFFQPCNL